MMCVGAGVPERCCYCFSRVQRLATRTHNDADFDEQDFTVANIVSPLPRIHTPTTRDPAKKVVTVAARRTLEAPLLPRQQLPPASVLSNAQPRTVGDSAAETGMPTVIIPDTTGAVG
ncbi:MAG: hypothetical protein EOO65_05515, partial [Methanosarcinales archaeon]